MATEVTGPVVLNLKEAIRRSGRKLGWLARQTGYSENYIGKVANGRAEGVARFHMLMERELGHYEHPFNRPPEAV
jgi:hypothetical protein